MHTMKITVFLAAALTFQNIQAQVKKPATATVAANPYLTLDKKALAIPDTSTGSDAGIASYINAHFTNETEKSRAIFTWVASNIQYDVANMYAFNYYERPENKVSQVLVTRKGVCEHYASLFNELCQLTGIQSYVVTGYTKSNGHADYVAHAWNLARVDGSWYCFDATWGSGYVNNGVFTAKLNNNYYKVAPSTLIKTHMPFDYLWQGLYYPITSQQFYEGKVQEDKSRPYFSFPDSIAAYSKADSLTQYTAAVRRIDANGVKNNMTFSMVGYLRRWIEIDQQNREAAHENEIADLYNSAIGDNNNSVRYFNQFIDYRNKQFKPEKPDAEIQAMLDRSDSSLKAATGKLDQIKNAGRNANNVATFRSQISELQGRIDEQKDWLKKYFSKGKMGRRSMFTKITWFGRPVN